MINAPTTSANDSPLAERSMALEAGSSPSWWKFTRALPD